jgi:hypothetical protein
VRVVRPGGRVAVGGWVRPSGGWAETFADHLRRLDLLPPPAGADGGLDGALRAAGLTVLRGGEVRCQAWHPSVGAAWTAMLGSEPILRAIRLAGETPVRAAFTESVASAVTPDGVVRLPKSFRYVVAAAPTSTMWALDNEPDNETGARAERPCGRDEIHN